MKDLIYRFREIYGGWQFNVYFREDEVVKKPKNRFQIALRILPFCISNFFTNGYLSEVERIIRDREESIEFIKSNDVDRSMMANIRFDDEKIVQDRAETVISRINSGEPEDKIIDEFVEFTKNCWRQGFHEKTFNFSINHGYIDDKMVLLDIGELETSKQSIKQDIRQKMWENQLSYRKHLSASGREYFDNRAEEELTVEKLEKEWRSDME